MQHSVEGNIIIIMSIFKERRHISTIIYVSITTSTKFMFKKKDLIKFPHQRR